MPRIKIIKVYQQEYCSGYESYETHSTFATGIDWEDVTEARKKELLDLISFANREQHQLKADYLLVLIEEMVPSSVEEHLKQAAALKAERDAKWAKQREKEEKAKIARQAKAAETSKQRDLKALERLQKKLGIVG